MVKILFLGSGGGRVNLIRQVRGTGGFVLCSKSLNIHVDPGPGALLRLHMAGFNPLSLDAIIVTHSHIDHVSDAEVLVEAMTGFTFKKRGLLLASSSVLSGDRYGDKSISTYHQLLAAKTEAFGPNDFKKFEVLDFGPRSNESKPKSIGAFSIRGVGVKHDEDSAFGFVIELDGLKIGYTSDTEYLPSLHNEAFSGVDVLIANNLKTQADGIPDHLHSGDLIKLLQNAKPKLCILSHMGMSVIQAGPEAEAARIQEASGIPTIASKDGYYFCTERKAWLKAGKKAKKDASQKVLGDLN